MTLKPRLRVTQGHRSRTDRSAAFLLAFHSNHMGLFRTVSEINGDFGRKLQIFPPLCILRPAEGSPLELGTGACGQKTRVMGATGPNKKFHDIFSRLDTIHH